MRFIKVPNDKFNNKHTHTEKFHFFGNSPIVKIFSKKNSVVKDILFSKLLYNCWNEDFFFGV